MHEVFLHCFNMTGFVRGRGSEAEGSQMMDRSCSILRNTNKYETKEILQGTSINNMENCLENMFLKKTRELPILNKIQKPDSLQ